METARRTWMVSSMVSSNGGLQSPRGGAEEQQGVKTETEIPRCCERGDPHAPALNHFCLFFGERTKLTVALFMLSLPKCTGEGVQAEPRLCSYIGEPGWRTTGVEGPKNHGYFLILRPKALNAL